MDINRKFFYSLVGCFFIFLIYAFFFLRKPDVGIRKKDFAIENIEKIEVSKTHSNEFKSFKDSISIKKIVYQIIISKEINIWNPPNGKSPFLIIIYYKRGKNSQFYLTENPNEGIWYDVEGVKYNGKGLNNTLLELMK
jgi:hypothetical protein